MGKSSMKNSSFRFVAAMFTLALASGAIAATGCGGSAISSLCEDVCACERCTSNDLQTCQDKGAAAADAADSAGCSDQFAEVVSCSNAHQIVPCDQPLRWALSSRYYDGIRRTARGSQSGGYVGFPRVASGHIADA